MSCQGTGYGGGGGNNGNEVLAYVSCAFPRVSYD